ncbi:MULTISPECIES: sugar phosphate nucleotidyltransferase [unclassified Leptolyngbya]|uniref:nucleotidyltransferase family protein n=1 Tax=unclassified Leptolyngbya TaxID=2650499 RepID=UPI0016869401|nr:MULTISPECIES: sugar phosphate nucleotidyltransferase [unclassified Leptolyngbya]MBD1911323.1 dTDP-glucose pyrophosphorylase [Leptolyngbya sp. FACHB-8]MBD2156659.1 dTDP-glucose pyrophosphorylase [Leptolyngbya sp. FACHB-16]
MPPSRRLIGLIPAAGQGTRIGPLPMSKELFPLGFWPADAEGRRSPRVVAHYLLEKMQRAGAELALMILRPDKWDIPAFLGDGSALGIRLAYLTVHVPFGVPFSLNQAYPFVQDATVLVGFPDVLFAPDDAYGQLLVRAQETGADVVLGLFPTDQPQNVGVVEFDETGRVLGIYEKSSFTHLRYMWAIALWQASFTEFLNTFVEARLYDLVGNTPIQTLTTLPNYIEIPIGDVIQASIQAGLQVEAVVFESGWFLDIGTPANLAKAIQMFGTASP